MDPKTTNRCFYRSVLRGHSGCSCQVERMVGSNLDTQALRNCSKCIDYNQLYSIDLHSGAPELKDGGLLVSVRMSRIYCVLSIFGHAWSVNRTAIAMQSVFVGFNWSRQEDIHDCQSKLISTAITQPCDIHANYASNEQHALCRLISLACRCRPTCSPTTHVNGHCFMQRKYGLDSLLQ